MSNFPYEILVILLLILLNGAFSLAEIAVVSSRKARLQQRINEGDRGARRALELAEDPGRFLPTVQVGITLVGVLASVFGGATLVDSLNHLLSRAPALAPYSHSLSVAIVVLAITYFTLILGELVPKRLALHDPERVAAAVAGPISTLARLFSPLVRLLSGSTDLTLRLLGIRPSALPPVTEEEIHVLLDQGTQAGVFEEAEQDMVKGVFSLADQRVSALMTPRTEIVWLDMEDSPEEARAKIAATPHARFPVCEGDPDRVIGVLRARDWLLAGPDAPLRDFLQPPMYIPETAFASQALEMFKQGKQAKLMLVIDEFGGVQGLLTINDILEEIVGNLEAEEPQATQRQDGSWLLDGMLPVDEFKEIFNVRTLPEEENFETLGGFVMTRLQRVPVAGDSFEWNGMRFEVMDMDGKRVDKVLVVALPRAKTEESPPEPRR